ncbi:MAG: DUF4244 domain-containing protein [Jatrophihabitantaceae bacterium]
MSAVGRINQARGRTPARPEGDAEAGMATAEYAVGTVAAVAFAAVLFKVVHSSAVQTALSHIVTSALNVSL